MAVDAGNSCLATRCGCGSKSRPICYQSPSNLPRRVKRKRCWPLAVKKRRANTRCGFAIFDTLASGISDAIARTCCFTVSSQADQPMTRRLRHRPGAGDLQRLVELMGGEIRASTKQPRP